MVKLITGEKDIWCHDFNTFLQPSALNNEYYQINNDLAEAHIL